MIIKIKSKLELLFQYPKSCIFISGFIILIYLLFFNFLGIDDYTHILENPNLKDLNGLFEFWKKPYFGLYIPVTYSFWWIWAQLFGIHSPAFHILNALVHTLNSYLFFLLLLRLNFDNKKSLISALFFIFYPIQAASIAWISEFRGLLSSTFSLMFLFSIMNKNEKGILNYIYITILFNLAVLSKPSAVVLPAFAFLFIMYFKMQSKRNYILLSFLVINAYLIILLTQSAQHLFESELSLIQKFILFINNFGFYLITLIAPVDLSLDYGLTLEKMVQINFKYSLTTVIFFILLIFIILKPRLRHFSFGLFGIVLSLLPVLGFFSFSYQYYNTVADRYLYFSVIMFLILWINLMRSESAWMHFVELTVLVIPFFITSAWPYRSTQALSTHMISTNEKSFLGFTLRGESYLDQGRFDLAERDLLEAIRIKPDYWTAHSQYGELLEAQKRWRESVQHFTTIISNEGGIYKTIGSENLGEFYFRVGLAYHNLGEKELAFKNFELGKKLAPSRYEEFFKLQKE